MSRIATLINAIPWSKLSRNSAVAVVAMLAVYGASELFFGSENRYDVNFVCNDQVDSDDELSCKEAFSSAIDELAYRGLRTNHVVFNVCINAEGQCNLEIANEKNGIPEKMPGRSGTLPTDMDAPALGGS